MVKLFFEWLVVEIKFYRQNALDSSTSNLMTFYEIKLVVLVAKSVDIC